MIYVALCGIVGFLVFDGYRINLIRQEKKVIEIFSDGLTGVLVKIFVYLCAGALAIFASLDVLLEHSFFEPMTPELVGSYLRGFAIGLAGPAGISKYDSDAGIPEGAPPRDQEKSLDTLEIGSPSLSRKVVFALRRQFLR